MIFFCYRHIGLQVLDVGGADPQRLFGLHREVKDGGVMGGVSDEGGGHGGNGKWEMENGKLKIENEMEVVGM